MIQYDTIADVMTSYLTNAALGQRIFTTRHNTKCSSYNKALTKCSCYDEALVNVLLEDVECILEYLNMYIYWSTITEGGANRGSERQHHGGSAPLGTLLSCVVNIFNFFQQHT